MTLLQAPETLPVQGEPGIGDAGVSIRRAQPEDHDVLSTICFEAFADINRRHGFPPDFPELPAAEAMMTVALNAPFVYGVVAELDGRPIGSNFIWETGSIFGVGPITVDPSVQQKAVGRRLMSAVLDRAAEQKAAGVRLLQAAFNTTSMSLYTKLGFDVREPIACLQGPVPRVVIPAHEARPATRDDLDACADVCRRVHGHDRTGELAAGIEQQTACVVEQVGRIVGYTTGVGFFGHTVALSNDGLKALIAATPTPTPAIAGPGLLLPTRNGELFRWCLANGLRMVLPMSLMSLGLYNEPRGAFLPSILF